ncbi:L30e-like protein [Amniculicola lignicola CBS 123094]|uniref:L30e-like protein n=1 Tax=Amniculicola lignicola CBS 123094 TaxID=1392246 RepID=A0A6A5WTX4_9PLEO|nr:L30e-like protein [Amniculicola lignicola CBS 123094]
MGKDSADKKDRKSKDKKEKKEKRVSEVDGDVKVKKDKKDKKSKVNGDALEKELEKSPEESSLVRVDKSGDVVMGEDGADAELLGALVPFAFPLAEDAKELKKILRTVKKSAKAKTLRRGVKEVVKALRKSQTSAPSSSDISNPHAITIIAADISPMDVISHIPVLCEDHNIPYIYIKSRAELGEASATKRPTSVVMIAREKANKKTTDVKAEDEKEFAEAYAELAKLVGKASKTVKK